MVLYVSCKAGVPNPQAMAYYQAGAYSELGHASGWPEHACACAAQLVQAAGQQALACMHPSPSLGQIELCTCAPVCHFFKGCVCALMCQPDACVAQFPSPPPSWATKLQRLGTAALKT